MCVGPGGCHGIDALIIYEWSLIPISGNPSIVGDRTKVGNDRVEVAGSGRFVLSVVVTFRCVREEEFTDCRKRTAVAFTQSNP
ncbi:hypothetical protein [Bacillus sp. MUM 116]|uniref:hypothetical protein n=1 Tax=Bacillus sp. MUM 116 TaxID=1678002 RepID=UPI00114D4788|nr:hypothetical protein [Bacillus sp. MUM 116]